MKMSSFFIKHKPKFNKKRKEETAAKTPTSTKRKKTAEQHASDEEIQSDDAFGSDIESDTELPELEPDLETAQDKRLRLAKKYLEEIEKQERDRVQDREVHDLVSQRLKEEYLDSKGKLRRNIAEQYQGYNEKTIKVLTNKRQKLPFTTVVLSQSGDFLFTGSKTQFVVKWDLSKGQQIGFFDCSGHVEQVNGHKRRVHILTMALSSDMKYLALADGGNVIQIWCPEKLIHIKNFRGHRDVVTCLTFRRDTHQLYSGSKDRSVKIWSLDEMAYIESLFGHQSGLTGIDALSRERAITSGGTDCSIRIWKITEESQLIYNGHRGSIENVRLINDENFVSGGDDGSLCLWSSMKKKPLSITQLVHGKQSNGEPNWISAIATLLNTDLIASGSCDGFIRIWQITDHGKSLKQLFQIPISGFINSLAFSSDGRFLIAAVGQEHRLGRWWRIKEAKNCLVIVELNKRMSG